MVYRHMLAPLAASLLLVAPVARAQNEGPPAPFDAAAAWCAFETLLRERYGYFDRPGIDGNAILSAFSERARSAPTDRDFIDTLQLVSHNFVDPHFVVGPLDPEDWAVIPTASDLFGSYDGTTFRIAEVRAESDALAKGVRPGMVVRTLDGRFVDHERPYQVHVIPYESRVLGPPRRFVEYVAPFGARYAGKVYVARGALDRQHGGGADDRLRRDRRDHRRQRIGRSARRAQQRND